jgi:hypothetical protein
MKPLSSQYSDKMFLVTSEFGKSLECDFPNSDPSNCTYLHRLSPHFQAHAPSTKEFQATELDFPQFLPRFP